VFPIMDSIPSRSVPVVTHALILINVVVFFIELSLPQETLEQVFYLFGLVSAVCTPPLAMGVGFPVNDYWPFLTPQFLHGGWLHIIGNIGHYGFSATTSRIEWGRCDSRFFI
jgi:membrane associated rhomboid family serine protease